MKDFDAYTVGLMTASVCSSLNPEEVARRLNAEHPTGIDSIWTFSKKREFAHPPGYRNPCPCERAPETHTHYLFEC